MRLKTKLLISLIALAMIDILIPLPLAALLLIYVIVEKPPWFMNWVKDIYRT